MAEIPERFGAWQTVCNRSRDGGTRASSRPCCHDRNAVERAINKMQDWRGIATRYDKSPESYLAGRHLRATTIWIRNLLKAH